MSLLSPLPKPNSRQLLLYGALLIAALCTVYVSPVWLLWERTPQLPTAFERCAEYAALILVLAILFRLRKGPLDTEAARPGDARWCLIALIAFLAAHLAAGFLFHHRTFQSFIYAAHDYTGISHVISSFKSSGRWLDSNYFLAANGSGFYLGHHFSPILITFVPLASVSSTLEHYGYTLALWSTLGPAAMYLFVLTFAEREDNRHMIALLLAISLAVFPVFYTFTISNHYEIALLPGSFLLFAGVRRRRFLWIAMALILIFSVKEDVSVYTFLFGVYLCTSDGRRREGFAIAAASLVWFFLLTRILMPAMSGESESRFLVSYWGVYGNSTAEIIRYLLFHPDVIFRRLIDAIPNYSRLFIPLAFLPLLNVRFFTIVLLPIMALHALATQGLMHDLVTTYYMYTILPYVLFGLVERLFPLPNQLPRRPLPAPLQRLASRLPPWPRLRPAVVFFCVFLIFRAAANEQHQPFLAFPESRQTADISSLAARVPKGEPIHAMDYLSVYVPITSEVFPIHDKRTSARYVLLTEDKRVRQLETNEDVEQAFLSARKYGKLVGTAGDVRLYRMTLRHCLTCR